MAEESTASATHPQIDADKHQVIRWLADAPLFIDGTYVNAVYDAVIRPESVAGTTTLSVHETEMSHREIEAKVGFTVSLPEFLQTFVPGLGLDLGATAGGGGKRHSARHQEAAIQLRPIDNPHRQLIHLALHYLVNLPHRLAVDSPHWRGWIHDEFTLALPRALLFIDLPALTKFVPTAAELCDGRVVTFYDKLSLALASGGKLSPSNYPLSTPNTIETELRKERKAYWQWYAENFQPEKASRIVEEVIGNGGPIAWIDYRMPLDANGMTLHLSLAGRKAYDTGAFAYNFVQRGFRHGLRIVGALRSEPSLKVLAVFEK